MAFWWSGILITLGVGVGYFVRLRLRKSNWITFTSHSLVGNSYWIGTISYETFGETENSCCLPRFPLSVICYKFLAAKLHSIYVKESESEILERSELEWKLWKGRSWSQTFHLRLRNPGCHTWMMASLSLAMVAQSNFCNRDSLIDHKFSMGLKSGEFPGQSITFNFAYLKSSSLFQMKDTGQYPIGIFLHYQEMPFAYLEWLFSQLHQCICINSSYLNWHKWSYYWKTETAPEHLFGFLYYLIAMGRT